MASPPPDVNQDPPRLIDLPSRLYDRVEGLAVSLGQQAELNLIDLLGTCEGDCGIPPGTLVQQLHPRIAHVAAGVATAFRQSSLKLLLPELHRLLVPDSSSPQLGSDEQGQGILRPHPSVDGPVSRAATPRTSGPATAPPTPDTGSSTPPYALPLGQDDPSAMLPQLAPTWSQEDRAPAHPHCYKANLDQECGNGAAGNGMASAAFGSSMPQHGPVGSPPVPRQSLGLHEQQRKRVSAGIFDRQAPPLTVQQQQLLSQRRSLAGPVSAGAAGCLADLTPLMVPSNPFMTGDHSAHLNGGPIMAAARPRASCDNPPPPPPSGSAQPHLPMLQRSNSELPPQMFGRYEDGSHSATPTAFRGLTISSPQQRTEAPWQHMGGGGPVYDRTQPPAPPPGQPSPPLGDPADASDYSVAGGTDASSSSNSTTSLVPDSAAAAAAMMAAVQQHLQQQQEQQQQQQVTLLQQQLALSGRTLSGQFGHGLNMHSSQQQQQQQQQGEDLLAMLHSISDASTGGVGSPAGGYLSASGTSVGSHGAMGVNLNALALAQSWRSVPSTPAAANRTGSVQQEMHQVAMQQGANAALLSASLSQAQAMGQEQGMAMGVRMPQSFHMGGDNGSQASGGMAHSLPGQHNLSPFDQHNVPSLSNLMRMSPSAVTTAQRGQGNPFAHQQQGQGMGQGMGGLGAIGPMASSAASTLARCNSSGPAVRDSLTLPAGQPQQQGQQFGGGQQAGGGAAGMPLQPQASAPPSGASPPSHQQYMSCGSTSASAILRQHSGAASAFAAAAGALTRGLSCPNGELPDVPGRFKALPEAVQARIMTLVAANPVISVKDFDEKVVSKMSLLVDMHGTEEALAMLLHLEHRMRTKQGVMKNGPGYLDVAVSSHLDMLKAQGSCPKNMTTEEYAAHILSPAVLHELREAVQNSKWLQWSHLDQGIIQLIKKLPRDSAVEKLQEISYHSFKNVDNIKGCIMSILNSKIREDRRKQ